MTPGIAPRLMRLQTYPELAYPHKLSLNDSMLELHLYRFNRVKKRCIEEEFIEIAQSETLAKKVNRFVYDFFKIVKRDDLELCRYLLNGTVCCHFEFVKEEDVEIAHGLKILRNRHLLVDPDYAENLKLERNPLKTSGFVHVIEHSDDSSSERLLCDNQIWVEGNVLLKLFYNSIFIDMNCRKPDNLAVQTYRRVQFSE